MILFQPCILLFVHTLASGLSSPSCDELEERVAEADQMTEIIFPPPLVGKWVSEKCEVLEGPEYVLRSLVYFENETFSLLVHKYTDDSCTRPARSTVLKGRFSIRGKSWTTPGSTQCDYILERVDVITHTQQAADEWTALLNRSCPGSARKKLRPQKEYIIYNSQPTQAIPTQEADKDYKDIVGVDLACLKLAGISQPEVGLVRVQKRPPGPPDPRSSRVELFLGETRQKGTSFHTPLLKLSQIAECEVCLQIERSSNRAPPILTAPPRLHPFMSGEWVSTRCETRPMGLFLRRRLRVSGRTWHAEFRFFSDPKCLTATLVAAAEGRYTPAKIAGGGNARVPGAVDFDFMVERGFLTLHDKALVDSLQKDKKCGPPGAWQINVKRDLTPSKGCAPLGIVIPTTEYELVRLEVDLSGNTLLFLGHSDRGSKKGGVKKRPTAFQPPLLQCNAPELPPLTHFLNSYNAAAAFSTARLLVVILVLFHL
ncbi:protein APCDD1-like [Cimex lectularius]|uniref:APCDD1 domain-containing protein n=1 Tax=Cimex lectularius TaxID=79782 RepID=A0A8I6S5R7_CIMLE|nr:protein APCDD1-like [Cimex lectularius]